MTREPGFYPPEMLPAITQEACKDAPLDARVVQAMGILGLSVGQTVVYETPSERCTDTTYMQAQLDAIQNDAICGFTGSIQSPTGTLFELKDAPPIDRRSYIVGVTDALKLVINGQRIAYENLRQARDRAPFRQAIETFLQHHPSTNTHELHSLLEAYVATDQLDGYTHQVHHPLELILDDMTREGVITMTCSDDTFLIAAVHEG